MIDVLAWHKAFSRMPATTILCAEAWEHWDPVFQRWQARAGFAFTAAAGGAEHHLLIYDIGLRRNAWTGWIDGLSFHVTVIDDAVLRVHVGAWLSSAACSIGCLLCRSRKN